ncbi:hypothetical protein B0T24DRAFT_607158 [Lasiosphaeria ovina]|uniref:3'-5' exonuclease domain-containing protein n=1 Tax=Lasiosphaeria ovina TaxID=92902 RepID=A0AAE0NM55_9PEZI|nr:hypothetical protein B0T24DRAFT_607158 [Lasiosphaeria ovina]
MLRPQTFQSSCLSVLRLFRKQIALPTLQPRNIATSSAASPSPSASESLAASLASASAASETVIASEEALGSFLSSIAPSCTLYLDLEGTALSRNGTVSLITSLVYPQRTTRLIDVLTLGKAAFTTPARDGRTTLKSILEDPTISKYLWDVRSDADALWALYGVGLRGVTDLQLLENAGRAGNRKLIRGLSKSIKRDLALTPADLDRWHRTKTEGKRLMDENRFDVRPIAPDVVEYCLGDVALLPALHELYGGRVDAEWLAKVVDESARRIEEVQAVDYDTTFTYKKMLAPWGGDLVVKVLDLNPDLPATDAELPAVDVEPVKPLV